MGVLNSISDLVENFDEASKDEGVWSVVDEEAKSCGNIF